MVASKRTATRPVASKEKVSSTSYRGAEGRRKLQEEQIKSEARREAQKASFNEPFRFFVKPGQSTEIIIVDEEPDFFRSEHALMNPRSKRYNLFVPCLDEHTNCPACALSDKPAYFGMYLTIIDLTPYEDKDGNEVLWSKKIMLVKQQQQKKIMRYFEKHGTLRGMVLSMTRDDDKSAAIGNDIEFVEFVEEEELEGYVTEYTDKDGKVHEVIGYEPFDYTAIYPDMTEKQVAALAGGKPLPEKPAGRRGARDEEEEEEDEPRRPARAAARRTTATKPTRRAAREEPEDEEEEEEELPRTSRGRREAEEAPTRGRRAARREEPEEEPEEEEEAPRRARRASRSVEDEDPPQRPARSARRAAREEPEEEEDEDDPLPEEKPDRSARRAGLRPTSRR